MFDKYLCVCGLVRLTRIETYVIGCDYIYVFKTLIRFCIALPKPVETHGRACNDYGRACNDYDGCV